MSTFKTALRMALAHPLYLLIYTVFISLMGVFIAASVSWNSSQLTEYKPYDTNVIVVDRDNSNLSRALTKHLGSRFDLVTGVGDDTYDLADALAKSNSAKGSADCVFFIPEGFEDDLVTAARAGEALPKLDVTYGSGTMAAALSSAEASRWISLAGAAAAVVVIFGEQAEVFVLFRREIGLDLFFRLFLFFGGFGLFFLALLLRGLLVRLFFGVRRDRFGLYVVDDRLCLRSGLLRVICFRAHLNRLP